MSHYGIIKRQRYWVTPEWSEMKTVYKRDYGYIVEDFIQSSKILKHEDTSSDYFNIIYINIISEEVVKDSIITQWEGDINQNPLNVGETLVIDGEKFTINRVEKHIDGTVTYYIDDLVKKSDNYDELLIECENKYEQFSKENRPKTENVQISQSTLADIEANKIYQRELSRNTPWWIKLFK